MRLHTVGSLRYVLAPSLLTFVGFIIAVTRIECVLIVGAESRDMLAETTRLESRLQEHLVNSLTLT